MLLKRNGIFFFHSDYAKNDDSTYGQCAITAMIVNDIFGGTIHRIKINGVGTHYFNKIGGKIYRFNKKSI